MSAGFAGFVQPNLLGTSAIGPFTGSIDVPGVTSIPYTICGQTCPVPVPPAGEVHGSLTLTVTVGSESYSTTHGL